MTKKLNYVYNYPMYKFKIKNGLSLTMNRVKECVFHKTYINYIN